LEQSKEWENIHKQTSPENAEVAKAGEDLGVHQTLEKGHGRIEKRTYFYSTDLDWMMDAKRDWEKLTGIGKVVREVEYIAEPTRRTTYRQREQRQRFCYRSPASLGRGEHALESGRHVWG
jgi:hypothetical protein